MKRILFVLGVFFLLCSFCYAGDVYVKGYYRKDGTYVRPHHRSSPDGDLSNNYGRPSYQQQQQYKHYQELPTYNYDYDSDGIKNQYDMDDDNDGIQDNYDSRQYSPKIYSQPTYTPSSYYEEEDSDSYDSEDSSDYDLDE